MIEVVVLRCVSDSRSTGGYIVPEGRTTGLKGPRITQNTGNDGANDHVTGFAGPFQHGVSRALGLDGPWEEDDHEYYDARNSPPWSDYRHLRHRSYLAQYRPEPPHLPPSSRPPRYEARIINNYYYAPHPSQAERSPPKAIDPETQKQIDELLAKQNASNSGSGGATANPKPDEQGKDKVSPE